MAPGFQTTVLALGTLRAPSIQKWSLYKNGKKFEYSGAEGENIMAVYVKIEVTVSKLCHGLDLF